MDVHKSWYFEETGAGNLSLQEQLNISAITADLLHNRGINTQAKAEKFLYGSLQDLTDPLLIPGMRQAAERIFQAVNGGEKIVIYGDYDVDGICSIVILKECIEMLGGSADYYVPDRFEEGYGINLAAIKSLSEQQYDLLISVDCGITSVEEVDYAGQRGMDVIITDHHTPGEILPPAVAVVNPKLSSNEDNQYLCGTGVAYYLALVLGQKITGRYSHNKWLELAALATVADIVPLLGDNHILVRYGLQHLAATERIGLKALLKICALENKNLTAGQVGFVIAPRLNATGRLGSARKSIELLLTENQPMAEELVSFMNMANSERRQIEEHIFEQALAQVMTAGRQQDQVIIAAGDHWHPGVIGIVASRLGEKFYRPVIVISWDGETGKGSGRSIKGFQLHTALDHCKDYLIKFGGHPMAAGITIARKQFDAFAAAINDYSRAAFKAEVFNKTCRTDGEIDIYAITADLMKELKAFEPYGEGNPQPRFIIRNMPIRSLRAVGGQKEHISFDFSPSELQGIAFRKPEYIDLPYQECWHDVVGEINESEFRGKKSLQIRVKEIKMSVIPDNIDNIYKMEEAIAYRQLKMMIAEIKAGRPVVVLFPTVRCLLKYKPGLDNCIRSSFLYTLHGHMRPEARTATSTSLRRGRAGIYLMTAAGFKEASAGQPLPENLQLLLPLWMEEPLAVGKNPEDITESIEFAYDVDQFAKALQNTGDFASGKKSLIYCNRNATVTRLATQFPEAISEAALPEYRKRKALRRRFGKLPKGAFITDGNYYFAEEFMNIDQVVLADLPFSICETMFLLAQLGAGNEYKLILAGDEKQQERNWYYLQQRYPEAREVYQIFDFIQGASHNQLKAEALMQAIQTKLGLGISRMKMLSILELLADSGLCQIDKQGSIMEIKRHLKLQPAFAIQKSALYHEGINEKTAWQELVQSLNLN